MPTRSISRASTSARQNERSTPGDPMDVRFGLTAQDEMCYLVGFYYTD